MYRDTYEMCSPEGFGRQIAEHERKGQRVGRGAVGGVFQGQHAIASDLRREQLEVRIKYTIMCVHTHT